MKSTKSIVVIVLLFSYATFGQTLNHEIYEDGSYNLLGKIDKSGLEGKHYASWFSKNYDNYEVDSTLINAFKSELKNYTITLFIGTWCGDSKSEVPKLYKVLETANFPMKQLTVIAVGITPKLYKKSPENEEVGLNIHRVPTTIFYKNGKEVNRIVEHPIATFEKDITNIIGKNNYKSNYQIVAEIDAIFTKKGTEGLNKKRENLLKIFKGKVSSMYELSTYGRVLYGRNKMDEAIAVFSLNTALFPKNPATFMSLANTLGINGFKQKAVETLEKGIKLHPENSDLQENLEMIKSN